MSGLSFSVNPSAGCYFVEEWSPQAQAAVHVQPAGPSTDNITMQVMYYHSGTRAARQQVQWVIFTHSACISAWERASN